MKNIIRGHALPRQFSLVFVFFSGIFLSRLERRVAPLFLHALIFSLVAASLLGVVYVILEHLLKQQKLFLEHKHTFSFQS